MTTKSHMIWKAGAQLEFLELTRMLQGRCWNIGRWNTSHQGDKLYWHRRENASSLTGDNNWHLSFCLCVCVCLPVCVSLVRFCLPLHFSGPVFMIGHGEKWDPGHESAGSCQPDPALCSLWVQKWHHPCTRIVWSLFLLFFLLLF